MGKAKLKMELIKNEKARSNTFRMRKNSVMKKVYELAKLCDTKAMVIIFGPKQDTTQTCPSEPEIFPDNCNEVLELINMYKGQSPEDRKNRTILLPDFFKNMIRKAEKDLTSLRNSNLQSKYPTGVSRFSNFTESELLRIVATLENKIQNAKVKLRQIKGNNDSNNIDYAYFQLQQQRVLTNKRSNEFGEENQATKYRVAIDPHQAGFVRVPVPMPIQQHEFPLTDHYQDQSLVNFEGNYVGGASNIGFNAHSSQFFYNCPTTMTGTSDNITYMNNLVREPPNYYGENIQPTAQHLMQYHPMGRGFAPNQIVRTSHSDHTHDQFYQDHTYQFYQNHN